MDYKKYNSIFKNIFLFNNRVIPKNERVFIDSFVFYYDHDKKRFIILDNSNNDFIWVLKLVFKNKDSFEYLKTIEVKGDKDHIRKCYYYLSFLFPESNPDTEDLVLDLDKTINSNPYRYYPTDTLINFKNVKLLIYPDISNNYDLQIQYKNLVSVFNIKLIDNMVEDFKLIQTNMDIKQFNIIIKKILFLIPEVGTILISI